MSDSTYIHKGHGISSPEYPNHFIMAIDLISTQQASQDFFLNLVIDQYQLNSSFQPPCPVVLKFLYLVKKRAQFLSKTFKKPYSYKLMDENEIINLVQGYKFLKYKFVGVFEADNFPVNLSHNKFIIVNVSTSPSMGTHWTLICCKNGDYVFANPLEQNLTSYKHLHNRVIPLLIIFRLCMNC